MNTIIQTPAASFHPSFSEYSTCFFNKGMRAPTIQEKIYDSITNNLVATFSINHSRHSLSRSQSRGISSSDIMLAMDYGDVECKQGLIFYIVKEKNIPLSVNKHASERIKNLVVVVSNNSDEIITCYKSKLASKNIRKKSKILKHWGN